MFDPKKIMDMMKQASEIQKNIQEELKNKTVVGEAGGGMVKATMNGQFDLVELHIDKALLGEDPGFVGDLIKGGVNDAVRQVRGLMGDKMKSFTGLFGL